MAEPSVPCTSYAHQLNVLQKWAEMHGRKALNSARVIALFRGRNLRGPPGQRYKSLEYYMQAGRFV